MKKLLTIFLASVAFAAFAINYQVWYVGPWTPLGKYNTQPIANSSNRIAEMVFESQNGKVYLTSGASTPIVGVKPESQPAAWINISG
jgi:hypothetical protein